MTRRSDRAHERTRFGGRRLSALLLALVAVLSLGTVGCHGGAADPGDEFLAAEAIEPAGTLGFTLTSDLWQPEWGDFTVVVRSMDGEDELGHEYFRADVDQTYSLDYGPGTYRFMLIENSATYEDQVFRAEIQTVDFDGASDRIVTIPVVLDEEATAQRAAERQAEEQARAEEEARRAEEERQQAEAARQAEEQARAEEEARQAEEARARAEAEAQAQRDAEAAAAQQNEQTIYITNTGEKYHNGGCRYLSKSKIPISLGDAIARGYEPCKVCH